MITLTAYSIPIHNATYKLISVFKINVRNLEYYVKATTEFAIRILRFRS